MKTIDTIHKAPRSLARSLCKGCSSVLVGTCLQIRTQSNQEFENKLVRNSLTLYLLLCFPDSDREEFI